MRLTVPSLATPPEDHTLQPSGTRRPNQALGNPLLAGLSCVLLLSLALVPGRAAHAQNIQNNSFEQSEVAMGGESPLMLGWSQGPNSGVRRPTASQFSTMSDGQQEGFIRHVNESIAQQTSLVLEANRDYTLTVAFGNRADGPTGDASFALVLGGTVTNGNVVGGTLFASSTVTASGLPTGGFDNRTLTINSNIVNPIYYGQALNVVITQTGGSEINFDNVTLNPQINTVTTPEASPALLLSLGLGVGGAIGLMRVVRGRNRV